MYFGHNVTTCTSKAVNVSAKKDGPHLGKQNS